MSITVNENSTQPAIAIETTSNSSINNNSNNDNNNNGNNSNYKKSDDNDDENSKTNIPDLTYTKLFALFLSFGIRAWGGPVVQIDMIKQQLVIEEKWISISKFNRILAVYQALPGPEATELACYFGMLAKGRIGSILGGLGFMLPGFLLMLLCSWLYDSYGIDSSYVQASFKSIQPCISAMIFRAVYRLAEHAFIDHDTKSFSHYLFIIGGLSALQSVLNINFFITLAFSGLLYFLIYKKFYILSALLNIMGLISYIIYVIYVGYPNSGSFGVGSIGGRKSYAGLFLLGLFAGLLTFGGAYTAIPFLRQDAVITLKYLTNQQFLDGLAIGNILPSPLVIISTFVGYIGGGIVGAILMTIGMFLPAFSFTLLGHNFFEYIIKIKSVSVILDGITSAVIGLVFVTAFELLKSALINETSTVLFMLSFMCLQQFKHRFTQIVIIIAAAIVGQVL